MNPQTLVGLLYQKGAALSVEDGNLLINAPEGVLDDQLLTLLRQLKPEIIRFLSKLEHSNAAPIVIKGDYPESYKHATSLAQQRILFMEELAGNNSYYNIPVAYRIIGSLDKSALKKSLFLLVAAQDILRTRYVLEDNSYLQYVDELQGLNIAEVSFLAEPNGHNLLQEYLEQDAHYIFDLTREWPIKFSLIECGKDEYVLSINIHHIAADGWSARHIVNEIATGYQLNLRSEAVDFGRANRDYQYADYVRWQTEWRETKGYQEAKDYWAGALEGVPELHSLPTDFTRPGIQSVAGDTYSTALPGTLVVAVSTCARTSKTTPFIIFQAAFAAFLARYSGKSDIVFGTAAANRQPLEFVNTVGLFVNTLALRHSVSDNQNFSDLIQHAISVNSQALRYQNLPFDVVVDEIQPARSLGYNPLVQLMLVMQENAAAGLTLDGVEVTPITQLQKVSKFDLSLHVCFEKNGISLHWEFSTSLFKFNTIKRMAAHFERLLNECLHLPERKIHDIPLVAEVATTPIDIHRFPIPECIHTLFERQVYLHPGNIAVYQDGNKLTYAELEKQTKHIAKHLCGACYGKPVRIGLCMEKSVELIVGLLAIMKIGAAYVPLDPYYPKERLEWMILDSGIDILLTNRDTQLPEGLSESVRILRLEELFDVEPDVKYFPAALVDAPAYIIYTSGSTGKPKGVLVSHRSLFYSLQANSELMAIQQNDLMPTIGSQAFGVSLLEILLPLISGGAVQVLKKSQIVNIEQLIHTTNNVTVLHAVPSFMRQWLDQVILTERADQYPRLRLLLVGGEAVPQKLLERIKQWRPDIRLLALYGMTESAVVCSSYAANTVFHPHYNIGKPHPNSNFYVLDTHGHLQPPGVPGELHIGSLSLATEYINQPEMTADRFIANPFVSEDRIYKTGDLVRLLDDGHYEFMGRVDNQVSLRGVRIELGEIESLALQVDGVKQVIAFVTSIGDDEKTLALYYTAIIEADKQDDLSEKIRTHLAQYIPDYMRPSIIQLLSAFPLNPNGKVDRKNLPAPDFVIAVIAPETDIEQRLVEIWKVMLQRDSISVTANFFEMGGHSLMAARLATDIRSAFAISLPLTVLFQSPTIRSCALFIEKVLKEKYAQSLISNNNSYDAEEDEELIL